MNKASISKAAAQTALLTLIAGSTAAPAILAAPAASARSGTAVTTIGQLEAEGFDVGVDRIGSSPLDRCVVTDIRNPRDQTYLVRVNGHGEHDFVPVVVRRTITVSLDCSR